MPLTITCKGFVTTRELIVTAVNMMFSLFCLVGFFYTLFCFPT